MGYQIGLRLTVEENNRAEKQAEERKITFAHMVQSDMSKSLRGLMSEGCEAEAAVLVNKKSVRVRKIICLSNAVGEPLFKVAKLLDIDPATLVYRVLFASDILEIVREKCSAGANNPSTD